PKVRERAKNEPRTSHKVAVDGSSHKMSTDVARGHDSDGGGDDRPPTHHIPTGCEGCFVNRGKGTRKPNLGGRKAGRLHTRQETRNLELKKITDGKGPVPIRFVWDDKKTPMPLGDLASHWSNYLGELIRKMPLYKPSWQKVQAERRAAIVTKIGELSLSRSKSPKPSKEHGRMPARIPITCSPSRSDDGELSHSRVPALIHTFFVTHTVGGVFTRDEDRAIYEEMLRLQALGSNTPSGVPYTEEEINAPARKGSSEGTFPVLVGSDDKFSQMFKQYESSPEFGNANGSGGCGDDEDGDEDEEDEEDGDS
nr:hypothetical protein [Tanacetum cinerariifolium]